MKSDDTKIQKIQYSDCKINTKSPNYFVLLEKNIVLGIESMSSKTAEMKKADDVISGKKWSIKDLALKYPKNVSGVMKTFEIESAKNS